VTCLIESHYLPCIAYFSALHGASEIRLERHEHFAKQTYRNRCHFLSSQGPGTLIVPLTFKHGKVYITDVRVDYSQKWLNNHWRTLRSAYGKAPFFDHYADDLERVLFSRQTHLYDLNYQLLSMCLTWLGSSTKISESVSYEKAPAAGVLDLRSAISAKNAEKVQYFYRPASYQQVFGSTFVANLSIVDLVFCTGPEALSVVKASARQK